jgi:hypothetical protein
MDLFAGYGSSSDEEENDPKQVSSAVALTAATAAAASSKSVTAATRRGKKIISLSAVLPQHILDQLTKSQVGGASDDSDDDDDDDNDDDNDDKVGRKPKPKPPAESESASSAKIISSNISEDIGLSQLLSDLHAAPTQGQGKKKKTANSQTEIVASEKMGAAFLSTTTTTTTGVVDPKQKGVRDVHSHSSLLLSLPVETRKAAPPLTRLAAPRLAAPVRRPISAAPPVAPLPLQAPPAPKPAYPTASAQPQSQQQSQPNSNKNTNTNTISKQSRKRSRKDLERALRQGNMDIVDDREDGLHVQSVQQAQPDAYTPHEESYAAVPTHGVKVVPTAMYDPSAGQAVVGTSAAGVKRGTNQINQLMASAANLEQQRTQGIGGTSNQAGKTHRANAKHKYGW